MIQAIVLLDFECADSSLTDYPLHIQLSLCHRTGSNRRHSVLQTDALPTELQWHCCAEQSCRGPEGRTIAILHVSPVYLSMVLHGGFSPGNTVQYLLRIKDLHPVIELQRLLCCCYTNPHCAARHGFEPRYPDSESGVLPLDDQALLLRAGDLRQWFPVVLPGPSGYPAPRRTPAQN